MTSNKHISTLIEAAPHVKPFINGGGLIEAIENLSMFKIYFENNFLPIVLVDDKIDYIEPNARASRLIGNDRIAPLVKAVISKLKIPSLSQIKGDIIFDRYVELETLDNQVLTCHISIEQVLLNTKRLYFICFRGLMSKEARDMVGSTTKSVREIIEKYGGIEVFQKKLLLSGTILRNLQTDIPDIGVKVMHIDMSFMSNYYGGDNAFEEYYFAFPEEFKLLNSNLGKIINALKSNGVSFEVLDEVFDCRQKLIRSHEHNLSDFTFRFA